MAPGHHHRLGFSGLVSPLCPLTVLVFTALGQRCTNLRVSGSFSLQKQQADPRQKSRGAELPVTGCGGKSGGSGARGSSGKQMAACVPGEPSA